MCGIALIVGEDGNRDLFETMLDRIAARGEFREHACGPGFLAGTQRLAIVDREHAVQPWRSADGRWLLCYNGEVFNHDEVRTQLRELGHEFRSASDTEVVLEAFLEWGEDAVARLRGEFAFAIVDTVTRDTFVARDPLGVKPLYVALRRGALHVASEIKALVPAGARIRALPPGHHGWWRGGEDVEVRRYFDLYDELHRLGPITDPDEAVAAVRTALSDAIRVRLDTDLPVGVVLSGGLDSSLVLAHTARMHPDCVAFTIGAPDSPDLAYARRLTAELGVRHEIVDVGRGDIGPAAIREAIRVGELDEYGDIINAVVSIPLFRRIRDAGLKVVLTGDGSDELFGGYPMYHTIGADAGDRLFAHKLLNLGRTELQRVDRCAMGQGVETRVPFLDRDVVGLAMRIPLSLKISGAQEKWLVREAFADLLPDYIRTRPKAGMSYSSGLHDRARLFKPWFPRLHRAHGYDLHEPIRRDFDTLLTAAGDDLDLALASGTRRRDYTPFERGKDLLGALRWNVQPAVQRAGRRLVSGTTN
ncbi:asparagine synthase (glutamine-hydrolyzing) [Prescottella subtropica]|uniref:asparagine synthase (glutamine-hydrolyzing) n=1 Tax=Prescottella subtropica TaxID=2545757 RepID=UPI0010F954EF|nr:asparagine synthase (glutamine-hydrolyzing) [Prescottella subtropica]